MAEKLGLPWSTYTRYETPSRYKKPHLPLDLARKIARVLSDHGIEQEEVLALAGVKENDSPPADLSAGEELLLDRFRHLDPDQRRLLLELAEAMTNARTAPMPERATVHEIGAR